MSRGTAQAIRSSDLRSTGSRPEHDRARIRYPVAHPPRSRCRPSCAQDRQSPFPMREQATARKPCGDNKWPPRSPAGTRAGSARPFVSTSLLNCGRLCGRQVRDTRADCKFLRRSVRLESKQHCNWPRCIARLDVDLEFAIAHFCDLRFEILIYGRDVNLFDREILCGLYTDAFCFRFLTGLPIYDDRLDFERLRNHGFENERDVGMHAVVRFNGHAFHLGARAVANFERRPTLAG